MEADPGPCMASYPRWFYNKNKGKCDQFAYGGCQGNANNFITYKNCQQICEVKNVQEDESKMGRMIVFEEDEDDQNPCLMIPSSGPCRAQMPRFYFDNNDKICKKFLYGGCAGNENNFVTLQECNDR